MWRKHFSTLLQGDDITNTAFTIVVPNPIDDDGVNILPPCYEEDKVAIMHLKNSKTAGPNVLPVELLRVDVMSW